MEKDLFWEESQTAPWEDTEKITIGPDGTVSVRGETDVISLQKAAARVQHEIHRLSGLLRFSPAADGVFIARCAPDYFVLPALAEHFTLRFGETPWAIIDERRGLYLHKKPGSPVCLIPLSSFSSREKESVDAVHPADNWEELWRLYHRSVNIEDRKNPRLQRQFMPLRYQKYLPEMNKE